MLRRFSFFFLTNIFIVITISLLLNLLGVSGYLSESGIDYGSLMVFCLVWGMAGSFISLLLSRFIAKMSLGVRLISPGSAGELGWLYSTVETLARRAGLPVTPEVGIYDSPEVNAFATGPTKSRALVAVSTGLLDHMGRQEIEGVLGHEIAHIQNGDMVTMTLLQGVVNAFVMFFARIIAFALSQGNRGENRSSASTYMITMLMEVVLGFLGMIVVAYFSRQREFRADKGSVKLAGPQSMLSALNNLAQYQGMQLRDHASLAPYKISGTVKSLFATHPPLEERIARLRSR